MPTLDIKNHTDPVHAYITSGFDLAVHVVRIERFPLLTTPTANCIPVPFAVIIINTGTL